MTKPIPQGHEGLIPHLVVNDAVGAIEYYKKALGAEELTRCATPDGSKIMHAELLLAGRPFYLCDDFPEMCGGTERTPGALGGTPVTVHLYVENCDEAVRQAADAGGTVTMPPTDMFWGDRYGKVCDPYGHDWSFATRQKDLSPEEITDAANAMFAG